MAKRRVTAIVKIELPAGKATPAPPVGTALGPHGVQTMEFVKQYNAATEDKAGQVIPVEITIFEDRSFTFILKTPPTAVLLRQAAGVEKGPATLAEDVVGSVTDAQLTEIARVKMPDLNANDLEAAKAQVAGTARSMGISDSVTIHDEAGDDLAPPVTTPRETDMSSKGKKHVDAAKRFDRTQTLRARARPWTWSRAWPSANFDETVELAVRLGSIPARPTRSSAARWPCRPAPASRSGWRSSPPVRPPRRPAPPAPTWSALMTSSPG